MKKNIFLVLICFCQISFANINEKSQLCKIVFDSSHTVDGLKHWTPSSKTKIKNGKLYELDKSTRKKYMQHIFATSHKVNPVETKQIFDPPVSFTALDATQGIVSISLSKQSLRMLTNVFSDKSNQIVLLSHKNLISKTQTHWQKFITEIENGNLVVIQKSHPGFGVSYKLNLEFSSYYDLLTNFIFNKNKSKSIKAELVSTMESFGNSPETIRLDDMLVVSVLFQGLSIQAKNEVILQWVYTVGSRSVFETTDKLIETSLPMYKSKILQEYYEDFLSSYREIKDSLLKKYKEEDGSLVTHNPKSQEAALQEESFVFTQSSVKKKNLLALADKTFEELSFEEEVNLRRFSIHPKVFKDLENQDLNIRKQYFHELQLISQLEESQHTHMPKAPTSGISLFYRKFAYNGNEHRIIYLKNNNSTKKPFTLVLMGSRESVYKHGHLIQRSEDIVKGKVTLH